MTSQKDAFSVHRDVLEIDPACDSDDNVKIRRRNAVKAPDAVAELGRTYQGYHEGSYFMPNDGEEQDRLGVWAIQYAEQNEGCEVVGTDLSAIQRESAVPNVSFVQQDVEHDEWAFAHRFDYIHLRFVITCFDSTKTVMRRAFDNLAPGGYIEFCDVAFKMHDFDGTVRGTAFDRWACLVVEGAAKVGRDLSKAQQYPAWCREVGFVDVEEKLFLIPCGPWVKDERMRKIGRHCLQNTLALIASLRKFLDLAGLGESAREQLEEEARRDLLSFTIHPGLNIRVTYGRKPE
ncbi:hypothetical protein RJ55_00213 [Drechmeria coniospora]|nr:hypothetical protein RJ55_00213 [Drechmeria coniospora]